jgi:hypothetical protein
MIWHYTIGLKLAAILEAGELRPSTAGVPAGERPAVWFSRNPYWERTANKAWVVAGRSYVLTREETEARGNGLVRFQVPPDAAPYDWEDFKRLSGASRLSIRQMERRAHDLLALSSEWRMTFDPVPQDKWMALEICQEGRWRALVSAEK